MAGGDWGQSPRTGGTSECPIETATVFFADDVRHNRSVAPQGPDPGRTAERWSRAARGGHEGEWAVAEMRRAELSFFILLTNPADG